MYAYASPGNFTHADRYSYYRWLSVCPHAISKPDELHVGSPNFTLRTFYGESQKPVYFGVRRSQVNFTPSVSAFKPNAILPRCCVSKARRVFPAVILRHTSNASDTGVSLGHVTVSACRWTPGFLLSACIFYLHYCPLDDTLARYLLSSCVRLSFCHTPVLHPNG